MKNGLIEAQKKISKGNLNYKNHYYGNKISY